MRFGAFETFKKHMVNDRGTLDPLARYLCGLGAGMCEASFIVCPMETIKVKFIHDHRRQNPRYKGFFNGVSTIIREEGLGGVYKGLTATILKSGFNQGIKFFVMETLKDFYKVGGGVDQNARVPTLAVLVFGAIAGACSVYTYNPIDVVKTRMQGLEAAQYKNTWDCIRKIWTNEGPTAFYKGAVPSLSHECVCVALTFAIYDTIIDVFNYVWPPVI